MVCNMVERKRRADPAPDAAPGEADEFVIGGPLAPKTPTSKNARAEPEQFVVGGPRREAPASPPPREKEFVIGGPTTSPSVDLSPLPRGWKPMPVQPPWRHPDPGPPVSDDLVRIDNPKKRYRGLSALKTYVDPALVEEVIDLIVYRTSRDEPGPKTVSEFIHSAAEQELARRRRADGFDERYPRYAEGGVRPRRGRRVGRPGRAASEVALKPVVVRVPEALAEEIRDAVIHSNGGQPDGANTVGLFVAGAVASKLNAERQLDALAAYPSTTAKLRGEVLDARVLRSSGGRQPR